MVKPQPRSDESAPKTVFSKLEKYLLESKISPEEALLALAQKQRPEKLVHSHKHYWNPKRVKLGIISDTHMGSKFFNYKAFHESVDTFSREKVDAIYHAGDVIEGMSNRDGHVYELEVMGTSAQIEHASKLLSLYKQPLFFTTGNHDEWSKKKANQGVVVGPELEKRIKGSKWLGEYTADIGLAPGVTMRLTHEGQTSYAISYAGQKRLNALEGGTKPNIIINGHLHKAIYMFYRNIHYFEGGTLLNQTPFMREKGTPAHVGYWVLDIAMEKGSVKEIDQKFFPFY